MLPHPVALDRAGAYALCIEVSACVHFSKLPGPTSPMASYSEGCWEREEANLKVDIVEEEDIQPGAEPAVWEPAVAQQ